MIANLRPEGWEIIYHRAHALLAAQLAGHWRKSDQPVRFYETLAAISHHDDLEREWEGNELTEAGAPLDFTLSKDNPHESLKQYKRLLEGAQYRGRWVTYLTSKHVAFLTERYKNESNEWGQFLQEQELLQERICKELKITREDAERGYLFMNWCDRLSLILTMRQLPDEERSIEIIRRLDNTKYEARQMRDGIIAVTPWCFEENVFTVSIEACYLTELKFSSLNDFRCALRRAPIEELQWTFAKRTD